jgi:uncharacterized protein (TIGR02145 family)
MKIFNFNLINFLRKNNQVSENLSSHNDEVTVIDLDGNKYSIVKIGNQEWLTSNLNTAFFNNGDFIPEVQSDDEWNKAGKNKQPACCHYQNDPANGIKYGKLYNWYAVDDSRGLAPIGWHIPNNYEWSILTSIFGGTEVAGKAMKSTRGWSDNGNGNNESGFSGFPGGSRSCEGKFNSIGQAGLWWSSTEKDFLISSNFLMSCMHNSLYPDDYFKDLGLSVRCLRNK